MASGIRLPHSLLNAYHSSNSLLYQFILSEFLVTYREMKVINLHVARLKSSPEEALSKEEYEKVLNEITTSIKLMAGSSQEYMRFFTWNLGEGSVAKLKNYCAVFSEKEEKEDKRLSAAYRCANRTWLLCLHSIDILRTLLQNVVQQNGKEKQEQTLRESLCHSLDKMAHHMRRLARLIVEITFDFKRDENIIYFLLRHQDQFDNLYGSGFISKMITKMFPEGIPQATRFIVKKYAMRGFVELGPIISKKMEQLQHQE